MGTLPVAGHPAQGGACSLSSLQDEVRALPGGWAHSHLLVTLPQVVPVVSAPSQMRCAQSPDGWWGGEETGAVAAGEFPKMPQRVFFFLRNSSYSSPPGPNKHLAAHSLAWPSPKTPAAAPAPGLALLPPCTARSWVPGTLLSLSTLLTVRSFNVLYLWPLIFIYAGILLAVRSAPQIS